MHAMGSRSYSSMGKDPPTNAPVSRICYLLEGKEVRVGACPRVPSNVQGLLWYGYPTSA